MEKTMDTKQIIQNLLTEIEETDPEMFPPRSEVEKGETVLGTVTDDYIKKVYSLSVFYRREGKRIQVDMEAAGESDQFRSEIFKMQARHEILSELLWLLLRSRFQHWHTGVGIREYWQFVSLNEKKEKAVAQLPKFLRDLLDE